MQSMLASPLSILLKGRRWTRQVEVTAFFAGYTSQFRWMAFRGRELWTMEEWSRRYHHKSVTFSWKYSTNSSVVNEGAAVKSTVLETIFIVNHGFPCGVSTVSRNDNLPFFALTVMYVRRVYIGLIQH